MKSSEVPQAAAPFSVPVIDGSQAQGDLIVVPLSVIAPSVHVRERAVWRDVPPDGVELLRGVAGGNTHSLVAEPGTCRWTSHVHDPAYLSVCVFETSAVAYLMHPEHGASGCAPGTYLVRRQREHGGDARPRLVLD
ncbi:hypothetical protein BJF79_29640 [Actinomadura sp. CNU-125]|uniref:hypothetical protein n=1 Tax=Actinomadura sp. CNU-125 TaxID=1904961 RepID=UPI00095F45BE|nr:hypothetical protein [Actinomadura sp. CNU-125]OLT37358.1 hypothetical protein BJF79_29640 [Actinomadura sp. CNU-125]